MFEQLASGSSPSVEFDELKTDFFGPPRKGLRLKATSQNPQVSLALRLPPKPNLLHL
jgi:hypothetical protein